jgi:signal transduction histidine kinase
MRINSLALRLVAGAALWIAVALVAGGIALSALFRSSVERGFDARLAVLVESVVAASGVGADRALEVGEVAGEPRFEQALSGWYWQVALAGEPVAGEPGAGEPVARSRSLWDQILATDVTPPAGAIANAGIEGPDGAGLRLAVRDITLPGSDARYRYLVAGDSSEIEAEVGAFNTALGWSLGLLGVGLIAALLIQVRFGLQPLRRVRAGLVAVRAGEAKRLEGDFPVEIAPLSDEVNNLLDHNAAVVERARTHVSNLAHALKTPLAVLANESEREDSALARSVRQQVAAMQGHVDHHLSRARTAAAVTVLGARTELAPAVEDLRRTLLRLHAGRGIEIEIRLEPGLDFRGERQDLDEMLGNLMDNACKWGRSRIAVEAARRGAELVLSVDDDGPGLSPEQRAGLFERGKRLDEHMPGSGHGLAIVRDIAELHGGSVGLDASVLGGLRATLTLPAAQGAS